MSKEYLVLWEVSQKQNYIFSTNRLKEIKGASMIIENIVTKLPASIDETYGDCLVYNGGGSSLYKFQSEELARDFIKKVSRRVLKTYPGVEIFMTYEGYDKKNDRVPEVIDRLYMKLEQKKSRRNHAGEQLSFGIERECVSTRLPASKEENIYGENRLYSEEILVKIRESKDTVDKFEGLTPDPYKLENINEFSDLIGNGKNYMGIVHIDGNNMGLKFNSLKEYYDFKDDDKEEDNESYIENLKMFSGNIENLFKRAFRHMADTICLNQDRVKDVSQIDRGSFPLLPIIIAGDDITYAVNGELAIESARIFLEYIDSHKIEIHNGEMVNISACAGVSIFPVGYPFFKTYNLAEDLCDNSKRVLMEYKNEKGLDSHEASLIDWHIDQGDAFGNVRDIRQEYYRAKDGKSLNMRPLYIKDEDWKSFGNFDSLMDEMKRAENNVMARNKIKKLREILRLGEDATELYLRSNKLEDYLSRPMGLGEEGEGAFCFYKDTCMYYDVLETMDMYLKLDRRD